MKSIFAKRFYGIMIPVVIIAIVFSNYTFAQQYRLTAPPSGNNQHAVVTQYIGLVKVTVDYNSPNVTSPSGEDRTGKIWGQLVPYGTPKSDFGLLEPMPWRGGANEGTTIEFSHDVMLEGKKVAAGKYGVHFIPEAQEWTLILSNNSWQWGSYFYRESEDALRVKVKPAKNEFRQWLTYEFLERKPTSAVCAMMWENLRVTFAITVPNINDYYVAQMRKELQGEIGFSWQNWQQAANFCLQNNVNLEEAVRWADYSISGAFIGEKNFSTLSTKAGLLAKLGKQQSADSLMNTAIALPSAAVMDLHTYARTLQAQGRKQDAVKIFELNAQRNPKEWVTQWGLARGYSALGDFSKALKAAEKALTLGPDDSNKRNIQAGIEKLKAGKDIN
ncbi:MAG: DUF2911 domain-containing protein [Candidatus Kapabacteria bacterium]|jgi:hypothetical protein|nr:DUF2911 domain-containing protein [Candidatus Kapabacteria bacterium]